MSSIDHSKYTFVSATFASVKDDSSVIHVVPTIAEFEKKWENRPITNAYQFSRKWCDMVDEDEDDEEFDNSCNDKYFKSFLVGSIPSIKTVITEESNEKTNITTDVTEESNSTSESTMLLNEKQHESVSNNTTSTEFNSSNIYSESKIIPRINDFTEIHIDNFSYCTRDFHSNSDFIENSLFNNFNKKLEDKVSGNPKNPNENKNKMNDYKLNKMIKPFNETFYRDFPIPISQYYANENISLFKNNIDNTSTRSTTLKKTKYLSEKKYLPTNQISFGQLNSNELFKLPPIKYTPVNYNANGEQNINIPKIESNKNTDDIKENDYTQNSNMMKFATNESAINIKVIKYKKSAKSIENIKGNQINTIEKQPKTIEDFKNKEEVKRFQKNSDFRKIQDIKTVKKFEKIMDSEDIEDIKNIKSVEVAKSNKNFNNIKEVEANNHGKSNTIKRKINKIEIDKSKIAETERFNIADKVKDVSVIKDKNMEGKKVRPKKKSEKRRNKTKKMSTKKNQGKMLISKLPIQHEALKENLDPEQKPLTELDTKNLTPVLLTNNNHRVDKYNRTTSKNTDNILGCFGHLITSSSSPMGSSLLNYNSDTISTTSELSDFEENDNFLLLNNFENDNLLENNLFQPTIKPNHQSSFRGLLSIEKNNIFFDITEEQAEIFDHSPIKIKLNENSLGEDSDNIFLEDSLNSKEKLPIKELNCENIQDKVEENPIENYCSKRTTDDSIEKGEKRITELNDKGLILKTKKFVHAEDYSVLLDDNFQSKNEDSKVLFDNSFEIITEKNISNKNLFTCCNSLGLDEVLSEYIGVFPVALEDIKFHDLYEVNERSQSLVFNLTNDLHAQCLSITKDVFTNSSRFELITKDGSVNSNHKLVENNNINEDDLFLNDHYSEIYNNEDIIFNTKFFNKFSFFSNNLTGWNFSCTLGKILQQKIEPSIYGFEYRLNKLISNIIQKLYKNFYSPWNPRTVIQNLNNFKCIWWLKNLAFKKANNKNKGKSIIVPEIINIKNVRPTVFMSLLHVMDYQNLDYKMIMKKFELFTKKTTKKIKLLINYIIYYIIKFNTTLMQLSLFIFYYFCYYFVIGMLKFC